MIPRVGYLTYLKVARQRTLSKKDLGLGRTHIQLARVRDHEAEVCVRVEGMVAASRVTKAQDPLTAVRRPNCA